MRVKETARGAGAAGRLRQRGASNGARREPHRSLPHRAAGCAGSTGEEKSHEERARGTRRDRGREAEEPRLRSLGQRGAGSPLALCHQGSRSLTQKLRVPSLRKQTPNSPFSVLCRALPLHSSRGTRNGSGRGARARPGTCPARRARPPQAPAQQSRRETTSAGLSVSGC